jgi:hypothetical protein
VSPCSADNADPGRIGLAVFGHGRPLARPGGDRLRGRTHGRRGLSVGERDRVEFAAFSESLHRRFLLEIVPLLEYVAADQQRLKPA